MGPRPLELLTLVVSSDLATRHRERNFDSKLATPDSRPRPNAVPGLPRSLELNDPFFFDSLNRNSSFETARETIRLLTEWSDVCRSVGMFRSSLNGHLSSSSGKRYFREMRFHRDLHGRRRNASQTSRCLSRCEWPKEAIQRPAKRHVRFSAEIQRPEFSQSSILLGFGLRVLFLTLRDGGQPPGVVRLSRSPG